MVKLNRKVTLKRKVNVEKPPKKKNKLLLPLSISLLLVVLIVGAYFLFRGNSPDVADTVSDTPVVDTTNNTQEPKDSVGNKPTEPELPYKQGETYKVYQFPFGKGNYSQPDPELDKLAKVLTDNPAVKIQIFAYTDIVGSAKSNQILSQTRAKAIYDYLVSKGVDKSRLSYQGKGISTKYNSNAENRRAEFVLN
jgi:outer membrane protein OmpA-like peptidoglycan-associated protein